MSIESRKAELAEKQFEGPDPKASQGEKTFGTGDAAGSTGRR